MTHADFGALRTSLRLDFEQRIQQAVQDKDWRRLEHTARQWLQADPQNKECFVWLARGALALKQLQKAAYAYGRVLDFEPNHAEAKDFFEKYPSTLTSKTPSSVGIGSKDVHETSSAGQSPRPSTQSGFTALARRELALAEAQCAAVHKKHELWAAAAEHFVRSFEWEAQESVALEAATCLHRSYQSAKALKLLKDQLYHNPSWIEGRVLLGQILLDTGARTDAQREWQHVLRLDSQNTAALQNLRALLSTQF